MCLRRSNRVGERGWRGMWFGSQIRIWVVRMGCRWLAMMGFECCERNRIVGFDLFKTIVWPCFVGEEVDRDLERLAVQRDAFCDIWVSPDI